MEPENDRQAFVLSLLAKQYDLPHDEDPAETLARASALAHIDEIEALTSSAGFNAFGGEFQFALEDRRPSEPAISSVAPLQDTSGRRSQRRFLNEQIAIEQFGRMIGSALLSDVPGRRAYPSAGGTYAVDVLVLDLHRVRVSGHSPLYMFDFSGPGLVMLPSREAGTEAVRAILDGFPAEPGNTTGDLNGHFHAPSFVCLYLISKRTAARRYLTRGIRFALMEVGSIYQLLSDAALRNGMGSCLFGASREFLAKQHLGFEPGGYLFAVAHVFGMPEPADAARE